MKKDCVNIRKLRVKVKSLAEEARIIRKEEKKVLKDPRANYWEFYQLYSHRVHDVRHEARATQLAMAFLKNMPADVCEPERKEENIDRYLVERIVSMIFKYHFGTPWENSNNFASVNYLQKDNLQHYATVEHMVWHWLLNWDGE